ncbi:MAG: fibronectin type III domain-containing protein [Ilumatobacteraceae bacterium]
MARLRISSLLAGVLLVASGVVTAVAAPVAHAATGTVTDTNLCGGPGSFKALLDAANANPGPDTIEFTAGLKVEAWTCNTLSSGITGYPLMTTGPLTIVGNGATVLGRQVYVNPNGLVNDPNMCPSLTATMTASPSIGLLEVGDFDVDNTGVTVVVSDLNFDGMPSLFLVEKNASLTLTDSIAERTLSFNGSCNRAPIEAREGSVHLTSVVFHESSAPELDQFNAATTLSVVAGYLAGALTMDHVVMDANFVGRAVYWQGTSAKIASSLFYNSGGLWLDAPSSKVVNSVIWSNSRHATDRIVSTVGTVRFDASTIYFNQPQCDQCALPGLGLVTGGTGTFDLHSTAIGAAADYPNVERLLWGNTATGFTSDNLTWVQPTSAQNAGAINAILPNALTGSPGLTSSFVPGFSGDAVTDVTPLLGTVGTPGVLLDAVDPGDCAGVNAVLNPIDDTCITTDVFGKPRWDAGNNKRNIGAVQNVSSPHLAVTAVGDTTVDLMWNRPTEPGSGTITGYTISYRPTGVGSFTTVAVTGGDTTTHQVTGLTNGVEHEFTVTATYTSGSSPASNTVHATPLGPIAPPVPAASPGDGTVQVSWTAPPSTGGHPGPVSYYVVYRPTGTQTWIVGPGPISGRVTNLPGLTNGTTYDVGVLAVSPDGSSSVTGVTTATPTATPVTTVPTTAPSTTAPSLPATGGRSTPLAPLAAMLLVLGVAILTATRRRA